MSSDPKFPKVVGFRLISRIGGGAFSSVYKAYNESKNSVAACKHIQPSSDHDRKTTEKEMRIHANLKHRNVLEFINAVVVNPAQKDYIPGIYMLLELAAGGDLFDKIVPDQGVDVDVAHHYFLQLLDGMMYIHEQGVCHRDLKPENLLLDAGGTLKISDFGLSSVFKLKESGKTRTLTERCGSLPYVAPELNSDVPYQAEPIDVWGIGVILFTMLGGNTPWDEPTQNSIEFVSYVNGSIFQEAPWNRFGPTTLSLLRGLLDIDPTTRLTLTQAMGHPWCSHPSQLTSNDPITLAERLTQQLRENGDMSIAAPNFENEMEVDSDSPMQSVGHSQFTQQLMLFSQTQSGVRFTPQLTKFYARVPPVDLINVMKETLISLNVKCKSPQDDGNGMLRLRIGGLDARKLVFKGWVEVEHFTYQGVPGSFCVMQRDEGDPGAWRKLWKAVWTSDQVSPFVIRK